MASHSPFYTDNLPTGLRVAQVVGLTSTAFLAGKTFSQSFSTVPALLQAPAPLLAKQWKTMFDSDKLLAPAASLFSSAVFGYIAYRDSAWTKTAILYTTSASLLVLLVPYTFLLGEPVNKKLEEKTTSLKNASLTDTKLEADLTKDETTHSLVDKWATVNFGRFVISAVSAALATWAAVERTEVVPAGFSFSTGANRM